MSTRTPKNMQDIPITTLLHFSKKKELEQLIGPEPVGALLQQSLAAGSKTLTKKRIANAMLTDPATISQFRNSALAGAAYDRYVASYQRLQNSSSVAKGVHVRRALTQPRKQVTGCLATRLAPEDYEFCVDNYDDPDEGYERIGIVPQNLRQSVFNKTNDPLLAPARNRRGEIIKKSSLPVGLWRFYLNHPDRFAKYLAEVTNKARFLRQMKKRFDSALTEKFQSGIEEPESKKRQRSELEDIIEAEMETPSALFAEDDEDEDME